MNCEKYLISIDDLIEGELDSENAVQVNSHLSVCPECAAYFRLLREEKEIYAQFLFAAEPPKDLPFQFQTKLENASRMPDAEKSNSRISNIFNYFRFYPALGFAAVLVICALVFWKFSPNKIATDNEFAGKIETVENSPKFSRTDVNQSELTPPKNVSPQNPNKLPPAEKAVYQPKNTVEKKLAKSANPVSAKKNQLAERKIPNEKTQELQAQNQLTGEQLLLKELDAETSQQIEKIEILMRAFRNARVGENSQTYDVAYEKQQARKLLGKNVRLRQIAENFGALYTEELLDKAEPFLLDIANLDNNPSPEKVLDIKERVKNQNIIASLQVY